MNVTGSTSVTSSSANMNVTNCTSLSSSPEARVLNNIEYVDAKVILLLTILLSLLVILVITLNMTAIVCMLRSMYLSTRTRRPSSSKVLMVSLSVADLCLGAYPLSLLTYEVSTGGRWMLAAVACNTKYLFDLWLCNVSIYHVMFMTVDRYLAVCKPFLHRTLPKRTEYIFVLIGWAVPTAVIFAPIIWSEYIVEGESGMTGPNGNNVCSMQVNQLYLFVFTAASIYAPVIIVLILYCFILRAVRQFYKRRANLGGQTKPRTSGQNKGKNLPQRCAASNSGRSLACLDVSLLRLVPGQITHSGNFAVDLITPVPIFSGGSRSDIFSSHIFFCGTIGHFSLGICLQFPTETARTPQNRSMTAVGTDLENTVNTESSSAWAGLGVGRCEDRNPDTDCCHCSIPSRPLPLSPRSPPSHTLPPSREGFFNSNYAHSEQNKPVANTHTSPSFPDQPTKQSFKTVKTIGTLVACFVVAWLPVAVLMNVHAATNTSTPHWLMLAFTVLSYCNSALNPVLYCSLSPIRRNVLALICSLRGRKPGGHGRVQHP